MQAHGAAGTSCRPPFYKPSVHASSETQQIETIYLGKLGVNGTQIGNDLTAVRERMGKAFPCGRAMVSADPYQDRPATPPLE